MRKESEAAMNEAGTRLLDNLPAIYRTSDSGGNLRRLLGVFEEMLFHAGGQEPPGIEEQIEAIPGLFSPGGDDVSGWLHLEKAPDRFVPWLATWVAFTPHALFTPHRLRAIISRIAPLYGRRGTRAYLEQLLGICFPEISKMVIDDEAALGLVIGQARIGQDTLLGGERPFWFRVAIDAKEHEFQPEDRQAREGFEQRLREIIDFAKPAHTTYELQLRFLQVDETIRT
jgi:phage tail-like protein